MKPNSLLLSVLVVGSFINVSPSCLRRRVEEDEMSQLTKEADGLISDVWDERKLLFFYKWFCGGGDWSSTPVPTPAPPSRTPAPTGRDIEDGSSTPGLTEVPSLAPAPTPVPTWRDSDDGSNIPIPKQVPSLAPAPTIFPTWRVVYATSEPTNSPTDQPTHSLQPSVSMTPTLPYFMPTTSRVVLASFYLGFPSGTPITFLGEAEIESFEAVIESVYSSILRDEVPGFAPKSVSSTPYRSNDKLYSINLDDPQGPELIFMELITSEYDNRLAIPKNFEVLTAMSDGIPDGAVFMNPIKRLGGEFASLERFRIVLSNGAPSSAPKMPTNKSQKTPDSDGKEGLEKVNQRGSTGGPSTRHLKGSRRIR